VGKSEGNSPFGRKILEWITKKWDWARIDLMWFRIGHVTGYCECGD
jgi:hypothetical protein